MNAPEPAAAVAAEPAVRREDRDGVATLTLNRPRQFNAISRAMLNELQRALDAIAADAAVRVVVVAGAGSAFSGGHDLKEMMSNRNEAFVGDLFERCSRAMLALQALPQPVIARVHGIATAAGCQIVAACDLAVASTDARFATSGINYGLFCATPGVPVSRNVPRKRAFEMLFTGEFVDAETAKAWGLVNRVVPPAELDAEVGRLAAALKAKPRAVVAAGKALFYSQLEARLADAYAAASRSITCNMLGDDAAEGVGAFIEKRTPKFKD
ncbi:MAG TPA: enoyl-CoA hydratase [Casimicrobiaceae bacterium]|jgi:enoyl-CoA hydratase/carnithine racemase|nr:enoyl-CoA hydratase [Casimicrobiaceae bacterium]